MPEHPATLLNVYEVPADDGRVRHLLTFIEPEKAGASGVDARAIVGEVTPTHYGGYIPTSLVLNPEFVGALTAFMNEVVAGTPEVAEQARAASSQWSFVVDPRNRDRPGTEPPPADVIGAFGVDQSGKVIPGSFQHNGGHVLIDPERGISGLFADPKFYAWIHPPDGPG